MSSTLSSLAVFVAVVLSSLAPSRLSPSDRARVVVRLAYRLGDGHPVTRADIVEELIGQRTTARAAGGITVTVADPEPVTPDQPPITPNGQADEAVSLAEAAARLGVSVGTVKRYLAPSSARLIRAGSGVSRASLEALAGDR